MPQAADRPRAALAALAPGLALLAACWWLGAYVTAHGEPPLLWHFARQVRGHALAAAWAFTTTGWPQVLGPLYALCLILAIAVRRWRLRAGFLLFCGLAAWRAADALQRYFARPRRSDWLLKHELSFSYPSSHASISTAFYLLAALTVMRSDLPSAVRYPLAAVSAILWAGILWSRLALAAHYPTDVIGGVCLGGAVVLLSYAVVRLAGAGSAA